MANDARWEVWVFDTALDCYRFNACFTKIGQAEDERAWYLEHGYLDVDIRCRTTRYQFQTLSARRDV